MHRVRALEATECAELVRLVEEDADWDQSPDTVDRQPVFQQTLAYTVRLRCFCVAWRARPLATHHMTRGGMCVHRRQAGYAGPAKRGCTAPRRFVYKTAAYAIVERICQHLIPAVAKLYGTGTQEAIVLNWAYVRRYDPEHRPGLHVCARPREKNPLPCLVARFVTA